MCEQAIPRRRFMHLSLAGGASLLMGAARDGGAGAPLLRFIQVNDLHVQAPDSPAGVEKPRNYERANKKARWIIEAINRGAFGPRPDFVIGVGDLIHGGSLGRLVPDLRELREILEPLKCPFYSVVGNHEVVQQERSAEYLRPYMDAFGKDRVEYTFVRGGVCFIVLNNSGAPSPQAAVERNAWLKGVLEQSRGVPKIILCHIPLVNLRGEEVLAASFGFRSYRDHDPGTLELIEAHASSVIAVLSGHLHLTGMRMRLGVCHFSLSGSASYPSDGAAVFELFPDRLQVVVRQLPADLARSAPTLHGRPRHQRDYTDDAHKTAEQYQCGLATEREFSVPLIEGRRPNPRTG